MIKRHLTLRTFVVAGMLALILLGGCNRKEAGSSAHSVTISWRASSSPNVAYFVYRTTVPGGIFQKLTPEPIVSTRYTDTSVQPGHQYSYYVTSVDAKKNESSPSEEISAGIAGSDEPYDYKREWALFKKQVKKAIRSVR